MKYINTKKAFTIVELLVVMVILGILISLSIYGISQVQRNTRDSTRKNNLKQVQIAIENYYNQSRQLPTLTSGSCAITSGGCPLSTLLNDTKNTGPFASASIVSSPDTDFTRYRYFVDQTSNIYGVRVQLESGSSGCNNYYWLGGLSNANYKNSFTSYTNTSCWGN